MAIRVSARRSRNQRKIFQPRMNTDEHGWKTNIFLSYLCPSVSIRGKKSSQKHATLGYCTAKFRCVCPVDSVWTGVACECYMRVVVRLTPFELELNRQTNKYAAPPDSLMKQPRGNKLRVCDYPNYCRPNDRSTREISNVGNLRRPGHLRHGVIFWGVGLRFCQL